MQMSDLMYSYPDQNDPRIQEIVSSKREFRELASGATEVQPPRGELYPHQKLFARYLLEYDRHLLFQRAGTGKTCTIIGAAEPFKEGMLMASVDYIENYIRPQRTNIKRIYILTKSNTLIEEMRRQMVCICTGGQYLTDLVKRSGEESQRKKNITAAISPYYSILTYTTFVNDIVRRNLTDDDIREALNDTLIFVDEVQNLRPDATITNKEEQRRNYATLHHIFHIIERSKIILASATPMVDSANEIAAVMNLILPLDRQMSPTTEYAQATAEELEPYFRGMVSYLRELDTGARAEYQSSDIDIYLGDHILGNEEIDSQSIIYAHRMSPLQEQAIDRIAESSDSFKSLERRAANFVYPNGESDQVAFNRYFTRIADDVYRPSPDMLPYLRSFDTLRELSPKFASIIELCYTKPGLAFCYSDFKGNGGASLLGACMASLGFEQFTERSSVFVSADSQGSTLRPYCAPSSTGNRSLRIEPSFDVPRFALITSDTPELRVATIIELFNSPENIDGAYLKVVIGSPIAKIGLNFANNRQMHLVGPSWNQSNAYQAIARVLRTTSHVLLIERERLRLIQEGLDPATAYVTVDIYQHASVNSRGGGVDVDVYYGAESKDIRIRRVERIMKQTAYDCRIQYDRNVRATDIDGSPVCDYDVCAYPCYSPAPVYVEEDSYQVLYSDVYQRQVEIDLISALRGELTIPINAIQGRIPQHPLRYILLAIESLISNKTPINNRYGIITFLQENGSTLYLQQDYPSSSNINRTLSYYSEILHGVENKSLREYVLQAERPNEELELEQLHLLDPNDVLFERQLNKLQIETKVQLLESAILGEPTEFNNRIIEIYNPYIHQMQEPASTIASKSNRRAGKARIRRITAESDLVLPDPDGEFVTFHNLYNQAYDRTSYAVTSKFSKGQGRIRLYKPSEGIGFRDANVNESLVYNQYIQQRVQQRIQRQFGGQPIYGSILASDNKFRIHDVGSQDPTASTDARKINRGRICETWKRPELFALLYRIGLEPPGPAIDMSRYPTRQSMLNELRRLRATSEKIILENMSDDQLAFFLRWYESGYSLKTEICPMISNYFANNNLLLDT